MHGALRIAAVALALYLLLVVVIYFRQRSMLYFPTHLAPSSALTPWSDGQRTIGFGQLLIAKVQFVLQGSPGFTPAHDMTRRAFTKLDYVPAARGGVQHAVEGCCGGHLAGGGVQRFAHFG